MLGLKLFHVSKIGPHDDKAYNVHVNILMINPQRIILRQKECIIPTVAKNGNDIHILPYPGGNVYQQQVSRTWNINYMSRNTVSYNYIFSILTVKLKHRQFGLSRSWIFRYIGRSASGCTPFEPNQNWRQWSVCVCVCGKGGGGGSGHRLFGNSGLFY